MRLVLTLTAVALCTSGCSRRCGFLDIGGESGFSVFIGDLGREVPIEGRYKNTCSVRVTPFDAPINTSTAYVWEAESGYWEDQVEFTVWGGGDPVSG